MTSHQDLVKSLSSKADDAELLQEFMSKYSCQAQMHPEFFKNYLQHQLKQVKSQEDVQQAVDKIDVVMAQNSKCRELWLEYIQFMESPQLDTIYTEAKKETKLAQIFDKALDNVGLYDLDSAQIWLKYIDFEILRNNMAKVNLLCFMALETPLNSQKL